MKRNDMQKFHFSKKFTDKTNFIYIDLSFFIRCLKHSINNSHCFAMSISKNPVCIIHSGILKLYFYIIAFAKTTVYTRWLYPTFRQPPDLHIPTTSWNQTSLWTSCLHQGLYILLSHMSLMSIVDIMAKFALFLLCFSYY